MRALPLAFSAFLLVVMIRFAVPSLLPFLGAAMHVDSSLEGLMVTAYWLGYTAFMLPGGALADLMGNRGTALLLASLGAMFASYPLLARSYVSVLVLQFAAGSISAVVYVSLVSAVISTEERSGLAVGIYQSAFFIASSISIAVTPMLFVADGSLPFIAYGLPLMPISAVLAKLRRGHRGGAGLGRLDARIIGMGLIRFAAGFSYLGFVSWSTYYSVHVLHAAGSVSGLYALASTVLGSVGTVVGGDLGDRIGYAMPSIAGAAAIAVSLLAIYWLPLVGAEAVMSVMGFMYGFYASPSLASSKSSNNVSSTSAFLNFMAQLGGAASPYLIGAMLSRSGFAIALSAVGGLSIALITLGSLLLVPAKSRIWHQSMN